MRATALLVTLAVIVTCPVAISWADLSDGLVGYWSFDDGTATDNSGNGHDGTVNGAVPVQGMVAGALFFDGIDDNVEVPDHDDLDIKGEISISAWIYCESMPYAAPVVAKGTYETNFAYYMGTGTYHGRKANAQFADSAGVVGSGVNSNQTLATDTWYHLVAVREPGKVTIYIDSQNDGEAPCYMGSMRTNDLSLYIGFYDWLHDLYHFHGIIDEVRIYDRVLTQDEIDQLYGLHDYWYEGDDHKMHFPQLPDTFGLDIKFSYPKVLADDWECSETGAVTDVHFWFSARNDWLIIDDNLPGQIFNIHISIHANIPDPDSSGPLYSMPGEVLWEADFAADDPGVSFREYAQGEQGWYDPNTGQYYAFDHTNVYQCNIVDIPDPFYQHKGTVYWLDISVSSQQPLGWKTADRDRYPPPYAGQHFEDDAVWGDLPSPVWYDLRYPADHPDSGQSIDLAFVITGEPPGWNEGDAYKMHFPQLPDTFGIDVNFRSPRVLADDWRCSETGEVTDIHFWFSARNDWFDVHQDWGNQIFNIRLSIHDNIPDPDGYGPLYSMPGDTLWAAEFAPDSIMVTFREYAEGEQDWYDPSTGSYYPDDHVKIYQCNIVGIPDAFTQLRDSIYWLDISVSSQQPLGWKTADQDRYPPPYTGQHFEDDAVWGELPEPYWEELRYPAGPDSGLSIDLAFVITGDTTMAGLPDGKENRRGGFKLGRAYPNPFSLSTTVRYEVRRKSQVFLAVYNVMGERVRILVNDEQAAGWHTATWDGRNGSGYMVASGIYFVQMKAKHFTGTSKLIFLN